MSPETILQFCFPEGLDRDLEQHLSYWQWMMRGGADTEIIERFSDLPERARDGEFDDWTKTAAGRLALILILDQFPRSVFRGSPIAYAFDGDALRLCEKGLAAGHLTQLATPWERTMFAMPLVHAEGPDLRARAAKNVELAEDALALSPEPLKPSYEFCLAQSRRHQQVIDRFGRHPHRNQVLGRTSTPEELAYLAEGEFPHQRQVEV